MKFYRCLISAVILCFVMYGGVLVTPAYAGSDWYVEFFNNGQLSGSPQLTRYEKNLSFDWGWESPAAEIHNDFFSARLTREVWFAGGTYRFLFRSDDGLRLWVNDVMIIDSWREQAASWIEVDHYVPAGVNRVRIEYFELTGVALLQVGWEKVQAGATWHTSFYDNVNLAGNAVLSRNDAAISFDWGNGSPGPGVPSDNFSARWHRPLGFEAGTYRFYARADDGVRVFIDGQLILDAWVEQRLSTTHTAEITLSQGNHTVVVEYYEKGGESAISIWWTKLGPVQGWQGRYFDNGEFRGSPVLIRDDAEIKFDWGEGAPATWMPDDDFSAQWVRTMNFTPGLYRFNARADDGIRLWIDDLDLRLNHWEPQDYVWHYQDWHWLEGQHTLRVEYFEQAGTARIQFWWDYAATALVAQTTPPSPIYHPITSYKTVPPVSAGNADEALVLPGPWTGAYFATRDMRKDPVLIRTDPVIDFDWEWQAPIPDMPVNNFSVKWTGNFVFEKGVYRFTTTTDDGVRLYVDDRVILSNWRPMRGTRYTTVALEPGEHTVKVEYFEAMQAAKARVQWTRVSD